MPRFRWAAPYLAYLVLFLLSFIPQSFRPWDTVAYIGDSLEAVWSIGWNVQNLTDRDSGFFDAKILYPNPRPITYTDHRILIALPVAPVVWISGNPVLAYNVALALGCVLAAIAGRRLARTLGVSELGAWTAGALYAFHTYQVNEGPRLHIIYHGFLALAIDQFIRFIQTGKKSHAFYVGGWMLLQGLASSYHVLYGALLLAILYVVSCIARPSLTLRRTPTLLLAAALAGLLFAPIVLTYVGSARAYGFHHELPRGVDLDHYVSTTPTNIIYGPVGAEVRLQQQAPHFIGFVSLALALFAVAGTSLPISAREPSTESLLPTRFWIPVAAGLALLFIALSLGRDMQLFGWNLGPGLYRLLYYWVPGFQQVRIPERLSLLAMLFVALLVGRGISLLESKGGAPRALAFVLAIFVPLEHLSPLPHTDRIPVGNDVPAVYRWLDKQPVHALAEVPIPGEGLIRKESLQMYFSLYHRKRIIHGYESFPPLLSSLLRKMASEFPSEGTLQAFDRVGVDTVVVHHGVPGAEQIARQLPDLVRDGRLSLVARFTGEGAAVYEGTMDEVYHIVRRPPMAPAPYPRGVRRRSPEWRYRTKLGDPSLAADGDPATAWTVPRPLQGDEFYEITFDEPIVVEGLALRLDRRSYFPTLFKIAGRDTEGRWISLAWFDAEHKLQLLDRLMEDPDQSSIGFDLDGRELTGVRIMVEEGGTSHFGWSIPEIEVLVPLSE